MTPIEIIATVLAVFILVKILIIFISLESWLKIAEALLKKRALATIIYFVLASLVGYYVFSSLNVVQVAAVMLFTSLIIALGIIPYSSALLKVIKEELGTGMNVFRKNWLSILIWLAISVWILYTVFFNAQ